MHPKFMFGYVIKFLIHVETASTFKYIIKKKCNVQEKKKILLTYCNISLCDKTVCTGSLNCRFHCNSRIS